ncbi:MAG: hypothetical protein BWY71_01177 [Planctomycetes bacterium ADurb.Bin412]|nr:MAG: hypothetical protein BWY71_01177 [Planctomycetes bacterium ADurb.Bin412]
MKKMRIKIGRNGQTTIQVEGVVGPGCLEFTKAFEQSIGDVEERTLCDAHEEKPDQTVREDLEETL